MPATLANFDLSRDLARALDPVILAADCGITCDEWQARALRLQAKRSLWLCSRQTGKSTTAALMALHKALYEPGSLLLCLSPSLRQSQELFRVFLIYYHSLKSSVPELASESALRCEFKNGSRVLSLPGTEKTVRGYAAASLVIIDEACRVADDLLAAIKPTLATSNGNIVALSTPAGRAGWYYELWTNTDPAWDRVMIRATDCPRISRAFLDQELKDLGPSKYSQEYDLEFVDSETAAFMGELIEAAFSDQVRPLWQ
jgi:Terminase large subunit, T4likevirus-type, N-terminal